MPGKPISAAFQDLVRIASKGRLRRPDGAARAPRRRCRPAQASEYAKKLLALGYLSGSEARPLAPTGGAEPGHDGRSLEQPGRLRARDARKICAAARTAFEKALALRPDYHSPMFNLAVLDRMEGRDREAEDWLFRSLKAGHADPPGTVRQWLDGIRAPRKARGRPRRSRTGPCARSPATSRSRREASVARFRMRDCEGADAALRRFEEAHAGSRRR